jgi:aminopeptidase-like protein
MRAATETRKTTLILFKTDGFFFRNSEMAINKRKYFIYFVNSALRLSSILWVIKRERAQTNKKTSQGVVIGVLGKEASFSTIRFMSQQKIIDKIETSTAVFEKGMLKIRQYRKISAALSKWGMNLEGCLIGILIKESPPESQPDDF